MPSFGRIQCIWNVYERYGTFFSYFHLPHFHFAVGQAKAAIKVTLCTGIASLSKQCKQSTKKEPIGQ